MENQGTFQRFYSGRRGREIREYFTAYLMIAPAVFLIFLFGIFPVFFALYVSIHKWQLVRGDFRGLRNYIAAIDNLTYLALFVLAILAIAWAYRAIKKIGEEIRGKGSNIWFLAIPGFFQAAGTMAFGRWAYFQLPGFLDIARKIRGEERSRELFVSLLEEAFRAETVYPFWQEFTWIFWAGLFLSIVGIYLWRTGENISYQLRFALWWVAVIIGGGLLFVTFNAINTAYAAAVETGEDPGIWPQLIMLSSGAILLYLGWKVWGRAQNQDLNRSFFFHILGAIVLLVGAVLLIIEIPTIVASGDPDLWKGLKVTVFFSVGTVPVQLSFALFLSVLLFQKLKGSDIFRIIFFIPYVTPAVASAAVFKQLFSNRASAPANLIIQWLGFEPQLWLREPDGIFELLGGLLNLDIPTWAAGPSLALSVIIIQSVWTYVGYNTVIYLAGLGNISTELTEAAEIDGANKWQVFRHITFPLLSPTTYFLSLIAIIGTFKAFNTIWVLRDGAALGTTDPFSVVIFIEFFTKTRYGYASALAFILFGIIMSLTLINNRIQGSRVFYG